MEKTKKSLSTRLEKLNDETRKDNVVTFEQLGVDRLFVDESHNYKNLFLYTKMRNVSGIAQTEAQKSSDMFAKCQYLDELTGGKGVTFATGTPISNSMTELYTNMRYLQYGTLQKLGLGHFDSWASSFGETQTAIELAPEGTGYRAKTRFAKFFNLPELISLFKESADIQTPDMLKLPVPEAEYENVVLKPSEYQQQMVESLADRAEAVRNRMVQPYEDNMLKITNDGRKLALDKRLVNDMLPDNENSKAGTCVEKAYEIWEQTKEQKSAQLIFCDLSTPKGDGTFNVYEDVRKKLIEKGVPPEELGSDALGNIARINHVLESMPKQLAESQTKLETVEKQLETAKIEVEKPFAQEAELSEKLERLSALNALLNMDEKGNDGMDMDEDEPEQDVAGQSRGAESRECVADKPAARVSLKEKLESMKQKVAGMDKPEKAKEKEEVR